MINSIADTKKPLVGFFPLFYNLAESGRAILVAKRYIEQGGKAIFFSHGGEYEKLTREIECKIVKVDPIYSEKFIEDLWKYSRLEKMGAPFPKKILKEHVEAEIEAYKKTGVKLIVTTNNFPCCISARAAGIPLISITPKVIGKFTKYPEDAEFFLTRSIPEWMKLKVLNWYFPKSKMWSRPFNKIAKDYNLSNFKNSIEITKGDYTLYTDFLELLKLPNLEKNLQEFYIGPIFMDELFKMTFSNELLDDEIKKHLHKPGRSILFSLGSSGTKELFLKVINALNKTNYNVIAVYSSILSEDDLPVVNDNIILKKFVPSIKEINRNVNLAIIHGGQGTVYTAAYAGKPVIGIPMQFEQHLNLEILIKHGTACIESRRYFKEKFFLKTIEDIFDNYNIYLKKAQKLASQLPRAEGDKNAVEILLKITKHEI